MGERYRQIPNNDTRQYVANKAALRLSALRSFYGHWSSQGSAASQPISAAEPLTYSAEQTVSVNQEDVVLARQALQEIIDRERETATNLREILPGDSVSELDELLGVRGFSFKKIINILDRNGIKTKKDLANRPWDNVSKISWMGDKNRVIASAMRNVARAELGLPLDEPYIPEVPKAKKRILTEEFSRRVNQIGGLLSDETKIRDLMVYTGASMSDREKAEQRAYFDSLKTPRKWEDFLVHLDKLERGTLTSALGRVSRSYPTVGAVRRATIFELETDLSGLTASFAKQTFEKLPIKENGVSNGAEA